MHSSSNFTSGTLSHREGGPPQATQGIPKKVLGNRKPHGGSTGLESGSLAVSPARK